MELLIQALAQGVLLGATYGLVALGANVIYSVSGVVNFAHGHFLVAAMYLAFALQSWLSLDPYVALFAVVSAMYLIGLATHRILIRPLKGKHVLVVAQLTLGLSFALQGLLLVVFGGSVKRVDSFLSDRTVQIGVIRLPAAVVVAALLSVVLAVGFFLLLARTDFGRSVRAVHQNGTAAAAMGISIRKVEARTFAVGIAIVGIAGVALASTSPFMPSSGLQYTLTTFLIMILGGMGNFMGNFVSGVLIGVATACGQVYLSGSLALMLPFLVFVAVVLWRPQGLLGIAAGGARA
ncbi:branched-chain amino acid ABC transporter permease [Streptomyces sp. NPDC079167]|uniref:branched-chain amino acid ABC transporter permease n=1 Tax=Streptomyces sp. NPDC079167 TaxID=3154513 RepID=UPI0034151134